MSREDLSREVQSDEVSEAPDSEAVGLEGPDLEDPVCDDPVDEPCLEVDGEPCTRPGRFRRWFLRPLIWTLTGVVALLCVSQWLLDATWARDGLRQRISLELEAYFERRVEIDDIQVRLFPLSVDVWGLTLHGPERRDPDENVVLAHVPYARIEADLLGLRSGRVRLGLIRVERPVFHVAHFMDGEHNLVKFRRRAKKQRRFDVWIEQVEVDRGTFFLEQRRVDMSISAEDVRARMRGLEHLKVGGRLQAPDVIIRLPKANPFHVSVVAEGTVQRGLLEVQETSIVGPDFEAQAVGTCTWADRERRNCTFQAQGESQGSILAALGYSEDFAGDISFEGTIDWRPSAFGWRGQVRVPRLVAWDRPLEDVRGGLVADRYGARFVLDHAAYAGGTLEGDIVYEHEVDGRPTTVDLQYEGLRLDDLMAHQKISVEGTAASLSGNAFYRFPFKESRRGQGRAEITAAVDPRQPGLPLAGAFPVRIEDGVLRADSIGLLSDRQSILAAGTYDFQTLRGSFDYEVASADLGQLTPLMPLRGEGPFLWLPEVGTGRMKGTLFIEPGNVSSAAQLELEDVDTPSFVADKAQGRFFIDSQGLQDLRLELTAGDRALLMEGDVPFDLEDTSAGSQAIIMDFDAYRWPMEQVHPWLNFDLPFDGDVSGRLELEVTNGASSGKLRSVLSPASMELAGMLTQPVALDQIVSHLDWDAAGIRFDRFDWQAASGLVEGRGVYTWDGGMDLDLRSEALELSASPLVEFLPRHDLVGKVAAQATLQGEIGQPKLVLDVHATDLSLGDRHLGQRPSALKLRWQEGDAVVQARLLDMMTVEGGGRLREADTDLQLNISGRDIYGMLELMFEQPPDIGGDFSGELHVAKHGKSPADVHFDVERVHLDLTDPLGGEHTLENVDPLRLSFSPQGIETVRTVLVEESTDSRFEISGSVGYGTGAPLRLDLRSQLDTSWLGVFEIEFDVSGRMEVDGKVAGSLASPTLEGTGLLEEGTLLLGEGFPYLIEDLEGDLIFYPEQLILQDIRGTMAEGLVELSGRADFVEGEPLEYRFQVSGRDLVVRYPEGWVLRGETDLTLRSRGTDGHLIDGRADLDAIEYVDDIRVDFEKLMRGFLEQQRLEVTPTDSLLSTIQLNVDMVGGFAVRNNLADLEGQANLVMRGNVAEPILYGEIDLEEGGELIYNSLDYEIQRGRILFANPYAFNPEVDLVATTRVRDFDVNLAVDGTLDRLETRFTSEPPLPALEVFRLLATGDTLETSSFEPRLTERSVEDPSTSAATFLYGQAASVIGDRVNRLFGFDKFRIDPLTGSGDNLSKARVTVGKRLSKDVFVTFSDDPTSTEDQRLQVEWQVTPGLVLVLTQNGDDSYSADARWETGF